MIRNTAIKELLYHVKRWILPAGNMNWNPKYLESKEENKQKKGRYLEWNSLGI